jgi:hypothetical protein
LLLKRLWVRPTIEEDDEGTESAVPDIQEDVLSKARNVSPTIEEDDEGTESAVPDIQ